jgi:hypothetical protein
LIASTPNALRLQLTNFPRRGLVAARAALTADQSHLNE